MYLDSFNKTGTYNYTLLQSTNPCHAKLTFFLYIEIPLLLVFFVLVFLSSVSAYVHLYVREVYTFGIFVTLEFFQVYKVSVTNTTLTSLCLTLHHSGAIHTDSVRVSQLAYAHQEA